MAVRQHGSSSYKFGFNDAAALAIAASIGLKPQELTVDKEPEFEAEGKNEFAETEAYARGSSKGTFTLTGYVVDRTLFNSVCENGGGFTYDSRAFIIKGGKLTVKNTEFQMGEATGVSFPRISDISGTALN